MLEPDAIILLLVLTALLYFYLKTPSRDIKKSAPRLMISGYEVAYADQKGDFDTSKVMISKILYSPKYDLRGKPDFIFANKKRTMLIPVELKSGKIKDAQAPHYNDLMQLAAYFLIIEDLFSVTCKEGRIIYKDFMFVIKNSPALRNELLKILGDMRNMLGEDIVFPNAKTGFSKCRHCVCRGTVCEFCKDIKE